MAPRREVEICFYPGAVELPKLATERAWDMGQFHAGGHAAQCFDQKASILPQSLSENTTNLRKSEMLRSLLLFRLLCDSSALGALTLGIFAPFSDHLF